jgi:hypothetical protein
MTSNSRDPIRHWADKDAALCELAGEGWTITGPYLKTACSPYGCGGCKVDNTGVGEAIELSLRESGRSGTNTRSVAVRIGSV